MFDQTMLKIKRGEGPGYRAIGNFLRALLRSNLPVPGLLRPFYRTLYSLHFTIAYGVRWTVNYHYRDPAFRARCQSVGKNLHLWSMPDVTGHTKVYIGDGVNLFGHLGVMSGRIFDNPTLIIRDRADIGHNVQITVNKEVVIEEDVNIASGVRILECDAHPREPDLREKKLPPPPDEIKPVRICRRAWIGQGVYIMKGVTIGEAAVIGANSVVITV